MYEDDSGEISAYVFNARLWGHVELFNMPPRLSDYKHWKEVLKEFELSLKSKGISRYYTLVDSESKFRWCKFLGMQSNYETLGNEIEVMVKDF